MTTVSRQEADRLMAQAQSILDAQDIKALYTFGTNTPGPVKTKTIHRLYARLKGVEPLTNIDNLDILVFIGTRNQYNALSPSITELEAAGVQIGSIINERNGFDHHKKVANFHKTRLIGKRFFQIATPSKHQIAQTPLMQDALTNVMAALYIIEKTRPKLFLISNDHHPTYQQWMLAARHLGVPIAYIQHASVSDRFPAPLYDHALLDGMAASEIYESIYTKHDKWPQNIFLVGQQKSIQHSKGTQIGIGVNRLDTLDDVFAMALSLETKNITLRWHPGQDPKQAEAIQIFAATHGFMTSDPNKETPGVFLSTLSHLIAGNTSLILEAGLAKVSPIYWTTQTEDNDYYGFVKNGVAADGTLTDPSILIKQNHTDDTALRYYSASVGTPFEGHEGKCSADALLSLLGKKQPQLFEGQPHPGGTKWVLKKRKA